MMSPVPKPLELLLPFPPPELLLVAEGKLLAVVEESLKPAESNDELLSSVVVCEMVTKDELSGEDVWTFEVYEDREETVSIDGTRRK
jgi:hypothetical protein